MATSVKIRGAATGTGAVNLDVDAQHPSPSDELTEREIAARAYAYWEARGCQGGSPEDDWYRALREVEEEQQK